MNKTTILTAGVLLIGFTTSAQNGDSSRIGNGFVMAMTSNTTKELNIDVHGTYKNPIKKENLQGAQFLNDFMPHYPKNWIDEYISVEILSTSNGKVLKASSANNKLSEEQKTILNKAELATNLIVNVKYKMKNPVTDVVENNQMLVSYTIVPEVEAEYMGGRHQMLQYLRDNAITSISKSAPDEFQKGAVIFTINEDGDITNAKISVTSGNPKIDKLLLDLINGMPRWKPAKDAKGINVKQEFEFSFGIDGC